MDKNEILLKEYIDSVINKNLTIFKDKFNLINSLSEEIKIENLIDCKSYKIILNNVHIICNVINKYLSKDIKINDFINADKDGLINVVFKYNYEEDRKNISYISRWVRSTLIKIIAEKD